MRTPLGVLIILLLFVVIDTYLYFVIRSLSTTMSHRWRSILFTVFWLTSIFTAVGLLTFVYTHPEFLGRKVRLYLFAMLVVIFLSKLIAVLFFLIDDLRRGIQWLWGKMLFAGTEGADMSDGGISRSAFLSWLGIAAGGSLFGTMVYGFSNKYNYQVRRQKLVSDNLPRGFDGMKIVFFSDLHCGSLTNKKKVEQGFQLMLDEQPDVIIFGGDMVNEMTSEMTPFIDLLKRLRAPLGVFAVLGNHDYGDYIQWPVDGLSKEQNLIDLTEMYRTLGWKLLRNEHVVLQRNGDELPLIGVENWSRVGRFPRYGDLQQAQAGAEDYPFKILVSHDPSHWDAQVRPEFSDIDLMLSGHTHGFQFGVELPGFRWSPVQYVYKQWHGLYQQGTQKLYVNPGFGFIGYPGRVGVLPEITVLEFARS